MRNCSSCANSFCCLWWLVTWRSARMDKWDSEIFSLPVRCDRDSRRGNLRRTTSTAVFRRAECCILRNINSILYSRDFGPGLSVDLKKSSPIAKDGGTVDGCSFLADQCKPRFRLGFQCSGWPREDVGSHVLLTFH